MKMRKNISTTLTRMTRAEEQFMRNYFLAPVVRGQGVRVKIAGVICEMSVEPVDFVGFGIFLPISHKQAMLDRRATMLQRSAYLELFPRVQMIVCHHQDGATIVTPANRSDSRFKIDGAVELNLAEDVATFRWRYRAVRRCAVLVRPDRPGRRPVDRHVLCARRWRR